MIFNFKSYAIKYIYTDNNSENCILFLHGWGGDCNSFSILYPYIKQYNILAISFPPYYLENTHSFVPLSLKDYAIIIETICLLHNIKNPNIVCHSFGFRLVLKLTSRGFNYNSLFVTDGAGIFTNKTLLKNFILNKKIIDYKQYKTTTKTDYQTLKGNDKITFHNIIKENNTRIAQFITSPAFAFWGKKDKDTPTKQFFTLKKLNPKIKFRIVNSGHFAYLEEKNLFIDDVTRFLQENNYAI